MRDLFLEGGRVTDDYLGRAPINSVQPFLIIIQLKKAVKEINS